jgi:hypothetical protein
LLHLLHPLEDQTREFWNMSETKTNQVIMSDSAHAKLVAGVKELETLTGVSIPIGEVLDSLVHVHISNYVSEYPDRAHEIAMYRERVQELEGNGYRAIERE